MAAPAAQTRLTPKEYIAFERKALPDAKIIRHEYINGELIAMSGASRAHNLITGNIFGELRTLLRGSSCETYANEMRVSTPTTTSYFYPDTEKSLLLTSIQCELSLREIYERVTFSD